MITERDIDRIVISSSIIDLVKNFADYDEFMEEMYNTDEYCEAVENAIRWAIEYNKKYKG